MTLLILTGVVISFSSCKDDEDSGPLQLSFTETEMTVEESGTVEIEIALSGNAPEDIVIEYEVSGSATEVEDAIGENIADYEIDGGDREIVIPKGQRTGTIELTISEDASFEVDETIELRIDDVSKDNVVLTSDDEIVITIENDDGEATASFASSASNTKEDGELIEITVNLSQPVASNTTIPYTLSGTQIDSLLAWNEGIADGVIYAYDYYIDGVTGELQIPAGSNTGTIRVQPVTDLYLENTGTIIITLTATEGILVDQAKKTHTVSVAQEDGKIVSLTWNEAYTTVDMDLFHWIKMQNGQYGLFNYSFNTDEETRFNGTIEEGGEYVFIPAVVAAETLEHGMSYNYYEGTEDPMHFTVQFIDFIDGDAKLETADIFEASYTAANLNPWDDETNGIFPQPIAQTFQTNGGIYTIDNITVPTDGSRVPQQSFKKNAVKQLLRSTNLRRLQ